MDFNIRLSNGQVLKGIIISPGDSIKAAIIMVHGIGEHINRYDSLAAKFINEGIGFIGVDLPGHGKSDGKKGHIRKYADLKEMINILIRNCNKIFAGIPVYVYGHSLGGGIVLDYLLTAKPKIRGAIVTSPWLRLSFEPPRSKLILASMMKFVVPSLTQPSGLNVNHISHDELVVEKYKNDPLVHGKISVGLFTDAMASGMYSLNHAAELKIPVLLMHGNDDMITSPEASRQFAAKSNLVKLKIWEGGFHELHNEPFKDEVFEYIINWIKNN